MPIEKGGTEFDRHLHETLKINDNQKINVRVEVVGNQVYVYAPSGANVIIKQQ